MTNVEQSSPNADLKTLVERVGRERQPIGIMREGRVEAVLVDAQEFSGLQETIHLLSTNANAARVRQGLADYAAGNFVAGELCD